MKHKFYAFMLPFVLAFLLHLGCGVPKQTFRKVTYLNTHKLPKDTIITLLIPNVKPAPYTKQNQVKGDVTVSCEITPFSYERAEIPERNVTYADPKFPGYDIYEVANKPAYYISPNNLQFKIRIRNNQDRVLKLVEVPIILIVDGTQTIIPDEALVDWKKALIVKGFEKDFIINGPKANQLINSKVVYIAIHDVPVLYDKAGNVKRKENFEWTFQIKKEEISKSEKIVYSYEKEPIYKEQCKACYGVGYFSRNVKCPICNGSGAYKDKKGNSVKCYNCNGTGQVTVQDKCSTCNGRGIIEYPKSPTPPIEKEEIWTGWKVRVETNPPGAKVSVVDINTGNYINAGVSNIDVRWFSSSSKSFPIKVEYQGKEVEVLPFNEDGTESNKISIDFIMGAEPRILIGRKTK